MFKIVFDHVEQLKPYGYLIGEVETKKDVPVIIEKIKKQVSKLIK